MPHYSWHGVACSVIVCALFFPAPASAGVILITRGESINHVGDVTNADARLQGASKVGFRFGYWGVFWLDLWTHGGTYCVYDDQRFAPIEPADAARLLGKSESELSVPFLYRVPLGWLILGPLLVIGIVYSALDKGRGMNGDPLLQDPRYQQAVQIFNEQYDKQPANAAESQAAAADDSRFRTAFEAGVQHLVAAGVPREEGEPNLLALIQVLVQAQKQEADANN